MLQKIGPPRIILERLLVTIVASLTRHPSSLVKHACNAIVSAHSLAFSASIKERDAFFCHVSILPVLATPMWIGSPSFGSERTDTFVGAQFSAPAWRADLRSRA